MGIKPLHIWFEKIDGFIKIYDGIRYSVLFAPKRYNAIYDRLIIIQVKKVVLPIELIIYVQELELIYVILYLQKKP